MKKKIIVFMATAIIAIGGVSVAYAQGKNNMVSNKTSTPMGYENTNGYNNMINLMKQNGFNDAAKAMENRDFNEMNNFMNNLTDEDYNKMIDIMKNNGYASMAKMMGSVSRQDMINIHQTMMGRQQ